MRRFAPLASRTVYLRLILGGCVAVGLAVSTIQAQIPGRNVNMVSGVKWPEGDPFLQRQNEPSVAASTRNPLHLLGGSNDYRTVDVPGLCNQYGPDPNDPTKQICVDGVETGDAWLGLFKSTDGGQRWTSSLLPGYPQDQSPAGLASPLKNYQAGADAVVRAGTSGLLYFSGLVFDRAEDGKSGVFLARFIDNNNQEAGDPIAYLGTKLVASSNGAKFLDKPWMAVDIPRSNAVMCTVTSDNILPTSQDGRRRRHGYDRDERHDDRDDRDNRGRGNDRNNRGRGNDRDDHDNRGRGNSRDNDRDDDRDDDDRGRGGRPSPKPPKPPKPMSQRIPAGAVYVAYSSITGDAATLRSEILLTRSMDCGNTWSAPIKVSRPEDAVNQGSSLTIDPRTGAVYVGWRRFDPDLTDTNDLDAIMVARLPFGASKFDTPNRAHRFRKPERKVGRKLHRLFEHRANRFKDVSPNEATENLDQFDLGTTGFNFRTNAYPTMAADGSGRVYIAWTQRGFAADPTPITDPNGLGGARIVIATTRDGRNFSTPQPVDDHLDPGRGHQLMPSMAFAGGKLMLVFYDMRDSKAATHNRISSDYNTISLLRQTIDIRSAMASPGDNPAFAPSVKVSDYLMGFNTLSGKIEELQVNPPNLPMFKLGTVPFIGDYIDVAAAPAFVPTGKGKWAYNTASTGALPTFHAVWTDNRDVRPPRDGNWSNYAPPTKMTPEQLNGLSLFDGSVVPQCVDGVGNPGSRNQNVYSARITGGLLAGSPGNAKPLSTELQRGFVVFAQNTSALETKSFRMTILNQPPGGRASFDQFPAPPYIGAVPPPETAIEMIVPPLSTASRTVYVTSSDPKAQLNVDVTELVDLRTLASPALYPTAPEMTAGLEARVILNPDIENPDIENPDIENPDIENPDIENTEVYNPDIENPDIENVRVANPDIENPNLYNPDIENPDIENPDIENPDIENPDIENGAIADITWKVTNDGNTTASFNVNLFLAQQQLPAGVKTQLVLLKTYRTPVTVRNGCQLAFQTRNILLANIRNPILVPPGGGTANANDPAETNATLWLAPGEEGRIVLRVIDDDTSNNVPVTKPDGGVEYVDPSLVPSEDVSPAVQQQAVNSDDVDDGLTDPPLVTPTGANLFFLQMPTDTVAGAPIAPPVSVQVRDLAGAVLPGTTVTLSLGSLVLDASLSGNVAISDPAGIATFPALAVSVPGEGYQLTATAAIADGAATGVSVPFDIVASTVVVNTNDSGPGSLRAAMLNANAMPGGQTITFAIPAGPMGPPYVIAPMTPLPVVTDGAMIDGFSQPGTAGAPLVVVSGASLPTGSDGFVVTGPIGSIIRGLVVNNFAPDANYQGGSAVVLASDNHVVSGSWLGTGEDGVSPAAVRTYNGVKVFGSGNRIGGINPATRNVIAGNHQGVWIVSGTGNLVAFNNIGTTADGTAIGPAPADLPFANQFGVLVDGGTSSIIGQGPGLSNVISGNDVGVQLRGGSLTTIAANNIGLDVTGTAAIANRGDGVSVYDAVADTTIGGLAVSGRNQIAGNLGWGINLDGAAVTGTRVINNLVGLNGAGDAVPNAAGGVRVVQAPGTRIGEPTRRNIISGNNGPGVLVAGAAAVPMPVIQDNYIGTDPTGEEARPNRFEGVALFAPARVGGLAGALEGNLISGNGVAPSSGAGVVVGPGAAGSEIVGNNIGLTPTGVALGNGYSGITAATAVTIGGAAGLGNIISGNPQMGIAIYRFNGADPLPSGISILNNRIGTDASGLQARPNGRWGINLEGESIDVGGDGASELNLIAFNGTAADSFQGGIHVGGLSSEVEIKGNRIHSNSGLGIDIGVVGVTGDDAGDADAGANGLQNFPVLSNARNVGAYTLVDYDLSSFAPGAYTLRFFTNTSCDPSLYGEGETFVGLTSASASATIALSPLGLGQLVTATATDAAGNTSEFSGCTSVVNPPPVPALESFFVPGTAGGVVNANLPAGTAGGTAPVTVGILAPGEQVRITATGTVSWYNAGASPPDGGLIESFGEFLAPSLPAISLIARIGSGPWQLVGAGPTTLGGLGMSGALQLAVNDNFYVDNGDGFTAAVMRVTEWAGNLKHYGFVPIGLTAPLAEASCVAQGGHLASIHSEAENDFAGSVIDPGGVGNITAYIGGLAPSGLFAAGATGTYAWTDGSAWVYQNWRAGTGEPNGSGPAPAGVQLWPNNPVNAANPFVGGIDTRGWNDVSGSAALSGYLCKFP